jgi:hypothetical protein
MKLGINEKPLLTTNDIALRTTRIDRVTNLTGEKFALRAKYKTQKHKNINEI